MSTQQKAPIAMLGDIPVVGADRDSMHVLINRREVRIPCDMVVSPAGIWGNAYALSGAFYTDDGSSIAASEAAKLRQCLEAEYDKPGAYLVIE